MFRWNKERIFFGCREYFSHIINDIENASTAIDVESYIFDLDALGRSIVDALLSAASRGVRIRVLVDGFGSSRTSARLDELFRDTPIDFRVYNPIFSGGLLNIYRHINRRNHRKSWIFDGRAAYVGSMNITENNWKDYGLRVEGKAVAILQSAFLKAWGKEGRWKDIFKMSRYNLSLIESKGNWILLNNNMVKRRYYYRLFLKQIKRAGSRVWIANAYFLPQLRFIRAMCDAARRGIDVRLLVPKRSDVFFMPWLASSYYKALIDAGVKIYEYLPDMFHAKARIIDGWASLGSTNLDSRSLRHDLEADIRVLDPDNMELLEREYLANCGDSRLALRNDLAEIPWYRAFAAKLLLLFRYWL